MLKFHRPFFKKFFSDSDFFLHSSFEILKVFDFSKNFIEKINRIKHHFLKNFLTCFLIRTYF